MPEELDRVVAFQNPFRALETPTKLYSRSKGLTAYAFKATNCRAMSIAQDAGTLNKRRSA